MSTSAVFFYGLAAAVLVTALLSVTSRNIFRSAIYLLFSLIGIAGIYFWMDMQFVAAVQTIVYVGGIVVLIIFSIFLTQQVGVKLPSPLPSRTIFAGLASLSGFLLTSLQILQYPFKANETAAGDTSIQAIGRGLLSTGQDGFALPFELVSILLLAAMIGCIVIALKPQNSVQ
jgi:NADH-quinone oxidoreductase subunit J